MRKISSHFVCNKFIASMPAKYRLKMFHLAMLLTMASFAQAQTFNWAIQLGGAKYGIPNNLSCLSSDKAGNVYVAGVFDDSADFDPSAAKAMLGPLVNLPGIPLKSMFLAKYDAKGKYLWAKTLFTISVFPKSLSSVSCLVVDEKGNINVCGIFPQKSYVRTGTN